MPKIETSSPLGRHGRVNRFVLPAVVVCAGAVGIAALGLWEANQRGKGGANGGGAVVPSKVADISKLAAEAHQLQSERKLKEADEKWQTVENEIGDVGKHPELAELNKEAKEKRELLRPLLDPGNSTDPFKPLPKPPEDRPAEIKTADLLRYYPTGRMVQSVAEFVIRGQGTSKDWIFKQDAHFVSIDRVVAETKVQENDGHTVKFAVWFSDVSHNLVISDDTLELAPPESPLLDTFWDPFEKGVLEGVPAYYALKRFAEIANLADPRLKRTLTALKKRLRRLGVPFPEDEAIQILSKIDRLANVRIEFEYVDGMGVTAIKSLDGIKLPKEDLEALADSSGPMLDYFIFPGANKKVGDTWDVRALDVVSLIRLSYRYDVSGTLHLERMKDENGGDQRPLAVLKIRGGDVTAIGQGSDADEHYGMTVDSGFVHYSTPDLLAKDGKLRVRFDAKMATRDHLLFGAVNLHNVDVEADYTARLKSPGGAAK